MRGYKLLALATAIITALLILSSVANAQYWFQTGVRGSNNAAFNNGASVSIQTIYQNASEGSLGFWVGEDLSNGAFIQSGYEITNATGYYSSSCENATKSVFLTQGKPTWFWEYFTPNDNENTFCGAIGPDGSAGENGTFQTYSFKSSGDVWTAYFDNQSIGSINLGTDNSGPNPPSAFAEYAETNTNKYPIKDVQFKNLEFYVQNSTMVVPQGYSTVSYGKGSLTFLPNPYGIQEFGSYVDYFVVGSEIPINEGTTLWQLGYSLSVVSKYGNTTGSGNYLAYSLIPIGVPRSVNTSPGTRELFIGWNGTGKDSYTGNNTDPYLSMYANVTETANWKKQYYLNVTSQYGSVNGSGWYGANSIGNAFLNANIINTGKGSRVVFAGWTNGANSATTSLELNGPEKLTAIWKKQYYLNATALYGDTTGSGWYYADSTAAVSLSENVVAVSQTERLAFSGWSNGNESPSIKIFVDAPTTISAIFAKQYLVQLAPENSEGQSLNPVGYYNISGRIVDSNSTFLFTNKSYDIEYIHYKGVNISTNHPFMVNSPTVLNFKTPVYDIAIDTQSVFGTPVNAIVNVTFKNNTSVTFHSGINGTSSFDNVPYGYASGYANYFGINENINISNGNSAYLTFLTGSLVVYIIIGILIIVGVAKLVVYYEKKPRAKRRTSR